MPLHPGMHSQEGRIDARLASLPAIARKKYSALVALVEDTAALTRTALAREKAIEEALYEAQRRRSYVTEAEPERAKYLTAEVEELVAEAQRLNADRMRRESVRGNTEQILSQLKYNFLAAEGHFFPQVRPYTGAPAHPRDGENLADAILRVRHDISRVQGELTRVRKAPLTPDEARAALITEVNRLASIGKPTLQIDDAGKIAIHFPDQQMYGTPGTALAAPSGSASAMLCWLFGDKIIAHATANLDQIEGSISTADRKRTLAELESELFQAECDEESLVAQAQDAGLEAHRRPYASGLALLGLEVVPPLIEPAPTPTRRRLNGNTREDNNDAAQAAAE
jgi:hypothetical protein